MKYVKILISDGTALERELVKEHICDNLPYVGPVVNYKDGTIEVRIRCNLNDPSFEEDLDEVIQHIIYISELYSSSLKLLINDPTEGFS